MLAAVSILAIGLLAYGVLVIDDHERNNRRAEELRNRLAREDYSA